MRAFLLVVGGVAFRETPHPALTDLPALATLGWNEIVAGRIDPQTPVPDGVTASYGRMLPASPEVDTVTAHWEIAGIVSPTRFATPERLDRALWAPMELLGNCPGPHPSPEVAREHLATGHPILLTGPGSRLELLGHQSVVEPAQLIQWGHRLRELVDPLRIHHLVVTPLDGKPGHWHPLAQSQQILPLAPPRTILNALSDNGFAVEAIGQTATFFANSGITRSHATTHPAQTLEKIVNVEARLDTGLVFASLTGFDSCALDGGPPEQLRLLDQWLPCFLPTLDPEDLLILTSDHGCAAGPVRNEVPLIVRHGQQVAPLGLFQSTTPIASTLAAFFQLPTDPQRGWPDATSLIPLSAHPSTDLLTAGPR